MQAGRDKKIFLALSLFINLFLLYRFWADAVSDFSLMSGTPPPSYALKAVPGNAALYHRLGRIEHYDRVKPDLDKAIRFYRGSLGLNPFNPDGHYDMAIALEASGNRNAAFESMRNAYLLNPMYAEHVWNIAVFYFTATGQMDYAAPYFKKYLQLDAPAQSKAFDTFVLMDIPVEYVLSKVLGHDQKLFSRYMDYLIRHERVKEALALWAETYPSGTDESINLRLCDLLIEDRKYDDALSVWETIENSPPRGLISNPGFEQTSRNACFDWLIEEVKGVSVARDTGVSTEGAHSLLLYFEGKNVGVRVRQIVILEPGIEYELKADIRTEGITTTDGPYAAVSGRDCEDLRHSSAVFSGTNPWRPIVLRFRMPAGCRGAEIEFRRDVSSKFNNQIEGRAWIDGVRLTRVSD